MADNGQSDLRDHSTGDLFRQLSQQTTDLVRKEVDLAKAELSEKGKKAGVGAGMFGGAGLMGLGAFGALTTTLILALAIVLDAWLAALVVAVVYGAIAGVLALQGRDRVREAAPPAPEQTVETVKEDIQWAKSQAKSARR
ncbi:MAG TPA: phage holin family protein [Solirubrobacterales bacterium]|nr:phage holin family protein [Solirubrobacterales bacterium]